MTAHIIRVFRIAVRSISRVSYNSRCIDDFRVDEWSRTALYRQTTHSWLAEGDWFDHILTRQHTELYKEAADQCKYLMVVMRAV